MMLRTRKLTDPESVPWRREMTVLGQGLRFAPTIGVQPSRAGIRPNGSPGRFKEGSPTGPG